MSYRCVLAAALVLAAPLRANDREKFRPPRTVAELWAGVDPRKDALETRIVREWKDGETTVRYVTFAIGTFKGVKARIAAFYAFGPGKGKRPALLHLHGGGQRAFLHEVLYSARRGYACLSINWGGRPMERARPGEENTDWGAVDPTQKNVPGYFNLLPGEKYLDPGPSPRNNNWYLLTYAGRRGLTFLERQPEVDADRLGVYGHSMGGNLTVYVAGSDDRVKAAVPSAGGQGFRTMPWALLPEQRKHRPRGDAALFRATLAYQAYAPRIRAPLLWLGATNDFHGIMDDTYRTGALIPHTQVRYAFAPHFNHRFTPACRAAGALWLDQHLQGTFRFPETPVSELHLPRGRVPRLTVTPDRRLPIRSAEIRYAVDPDPQARFWRLARATAKDGTWTAELPILDVAQPLLAFANVQYRLAKPAQLHRNEQTDTVTISSLLHTAPPAELRRAGVSATDRPSLEIGDPFSASADWYALSRDNPHHWQYWTRKIADPKWRGPRGARLELEVASAAGNQLVVVLVENFFRPYRGRRRDYVAVVDLTGERKWQAVSLPASAFRCPTDGRALANWDRIDELGLRAYYETRSQAKPVTLGTKRWRRPLPRFRSLRWSVKPPADATRSR